MTTIEATKSFAESLFRLYPTLIPTQALYLDLEGSGKGSEYILSVYWPYLSRELRFSWLQRTDTIVIDAKMFNDLLERIKAESPKWIVVFSGGQAAPDERNRIVELLSEDPFPDAEWINLHYAFRDSGEIKRSVREHQYIWVPGRINPIMYSLEALELEFGIVRPTRIRGHGNCYRDIDGKGGEMEVLTVAQRVRGGLASEDEVLALREYCEADVKNMFQIARASERLVFSDAELRLRRRIYS
jgi:hypothetical protein